MGKEDRKNAEGYSDPTAYEAIKNVERGADADDERFHKLLDTIFLFVSCPIFILRSGSLLKIRRLERFGGRYCELLRPRKKD